MLKVTDEYVKLYNKALYALVGKETKLKEFTIDFFGYSTEIAKELGDDYMNPYHSNKKFIFLTIEQLDYEPTLMTFSFHYIELMNFIKENKEVFMSILINDDVVYGYFDNFHDKIETVQDLENISRIDVYFNTVNNIFERIKQHKKDREDWKHNRYWKDDTITQSIVKNIKGINDIEILENFNNVHTFTVTSFYTSLLGGKFIYLNKETSNKTILFQSINERVHADVEYIRYVRNNILLMEYFKDNEDYDAGKLNNWKYANTDKMPKIYKEANKIISKLEKSDDAQIDAEFLKEMISPKYFTDLFKLMNLAYMKEYDPCVLRMVMLPIYEERKKAWPKGYVDYVENVLLSKYSFV